MKEVIRLHYADLDSAKAELNAFFPEWKGEQNASSQYGTLAIVNELPKYDEGGNVLPATWTGIHVDVLAVNYANELEANRVYPDTPSHEFM